MFSDRWFHEPGSSYERPVPLVLVDPDDSPNVTVSFRAEWLPYILGALQQLLQPTTWNTSDLDALNLVQARVQLLIALFIEQAPVTIPTFGCAYYPMNASFITYYPQDPYFQPGYVPPWYSEVPLRVVDSDLAATLIGAKIGDVVALIGAFPNPDAILEHGLTAIHIVFTGAAIVQLHFVTLVAGAVAIVTIDNDGLNSRVVDTNADIIEAPPETPGEVIEEFTVAGAGDHFIDVRFAPVVDDSGIPLRYGGGMRAVVFCAPG